MRKKGACRLLVFAMFFFQAVSCKNLPYGRGTMNLNGMIYDFSNKPVQNYQITLNGKRTVMSDINGRFVIDKVRFGAYSIKGLKPGYEPYEETLIINNAMLVVYIRVPSQAQLLQLADDALLNNNLDEAEQYLKPAYNSGNASTELLFYLATVKFRKKDYREALKNLELALERGSRDVYVIKFIEDIKRIQENAE